MAKINFEKSIERLEEITASLEKGDLSLEETIKLYTEGTKLAAECSELLENAQLKITKLSTEDNK